MLDGMIIRVACKVKDLQAAIDKAWTQAEAKKYPHAQRVFFWDPIHLFLRGPAVQVEVAEVLQVVKYEYGTGNQCLT